MVRSLLNELASTMPTKIESAGPLAKKHKVDVSVAIRAFKFYGYEFNGKFWELQNV
jgi:hypothetical protein